MRELLAVQPVKGMARVLRWMVAVGLAAGLLAPSAAWAGSYLYVDTGRNGIPGMVSPFSIGAGGTLTQQGAGVPVGVPGAGSLVIAPNGRGLYAANSAGAVTTLAIGPGGTLTQQGPAVMTSPGLSSVAVAPYGRYLYVTNVVDGTVSSFSIGADGSLKSAGVVSEAQGSAPVSVAVSRSGRYVYVANFGAGTVSTFLVGAAGKLTEQGPGVVSGCCPGPGYRPGPEDLAVSPDGRDLYTVNFNQGTVSTFSIGPTGALTQQGTGAPTVPAPEAVAISPGGHDLFVASWDLGTVTPISIGANGALTTQGASVPSGPSNGGSSLSAPTAMAITPDGANMYVVNSYYGTVSTFTIGARGALTQQGTGQAPTGSSWVDDIVVSPDQGPTAAYSADVERAGSVSSFDAQASTSGSAPIAKYGWKFGDGTTATGPVVSHVYASPGKYTVTLMLTGTDGCSVTGPFTGRSAYCVSDPAASTSETIKVHRRERD